MDEASFQAFAERIVPIAQAAGIAAIIADDTRIAGRVKADGIHIEGGKAALAEAIEASRRKMMVGAGGAKTRDDALELGEERPDYIFFGRFGYDNKPEAHQRNLSLGGWWAEMIEIPVHRAWPGPTSPPSRRWPRPAPISSRCRARCSAKASIRRHAVAARQRDPRRNRAALRGMTG